MHRVLFLSYWVPPRNAIGTIRSAHLIKHLERFGWKTHVVTPHFDAALPGERPKECTETAYVDLKALVKRAAGIKDIGAHEALNVAVPVYGVRRTLLQRIIYEAASLLTYPDPQVGWLPFAVRELRRLLSTQHFDAVLTSAPPFVANVAAALGHGSTPWIADLRDLWAEDDSTERAIPHKLFDDRLERFCLSRAAALIASSDLSADRFARRYPAIPCLPIWTGYDPDEWNHVPFAAEDACTLLYAGTLYRGRRDPSVLFAAVREIFDQGLAQRGELRLDFYVRSEPWLDSLIERFSLSDVVRICGYVPRAQVLHAERRADRLLVFSWDGPTAEGIVSGKMFEYFGARRRTLAIGGPASSSVQHLLNKTRAGVRVLGVEDTKAEILQALDERRRGLPAIVPEEAVREYTAEACARQFAAVLDEAVSRGARLPRMATTAIPAKMAKNGMLWK